MILGQYDLVLFGIKWYWVNKGLLCLYILKKINGDVNRPTNRQGEYRAICLFRKLGNRKKAEICNLIFFHGNVPNRGDDQAFVKVAEEN